MWRLRPSRHPDPVDDGTHTVIDASGHTRTDPADAWETPLDRRLLASLQGQGLRGHPYRPVTLRDVPPAALEDLRESIGEPAPEEVFVLPSAFRPTDDSGRAWVSTPTRVLTTHGSRVTLWVDHGSRPGIRASIPYDELVALMDLSILLLGRLEVVGEHASFVVRYNAVNRPDLRDMLLAVRRSSRAAPAPLADSGVDPARLPLKWLNVAGSPEVLASGPEPVALAASDLTEGRGEPRAGIAVLTSRELVIATEPTKDRREANYGVDLVAVPRHRLRAIHAFGRILSVTLAAAPRDVEMWVPVDPVLGSRTEQTLLPLVGSR